MKKFLLSVVSVLVLVGGSLLLFSGCGKSGSDGGHGHHMSSAHGKHVDPVCKMKVTSKVKWKSVYKGKTYYFCMEADKKTFDKNPEKYRKK